MHLKVIACEVLARELYHSAATARNTVEISLFTQGLHDNSDTCRATLQAEIDAVPSDKFDAVVLGYGLCNNSIAGMRAGALRLVIPRAHDCISLFLGSRDRYAKLFAARPGTYYYTAGWLEYGERKGDRVEYSPASGLAKRMALEEMVEKYGEENGRFLFESMSQWEINYTHGALITFPFTAGLGLEEQVRAICREKGWEYAEIAGDLRFVRSALDGCWSPDDFLIVEPGQEVRARYDEKIVEACTCTNDGPKNCGAGISPTPQSS